MQTQPPDKRTPHFRFAQPADVSAVHALIERAYRGPETAGQWDSESHLLQGPRTTAAYIAERIAAPDAGFLLAEIDGEIDGCALIERRDDPDQPATAYFGMFAISPDRRGIGLGDAVLSESEARAADLWGAARMVLTVISLRTELMAWYERRGYARTGRALPFPFSDTTGELRRDFDLVELAKPLA